MWPYKTYQSSMHIYYGRRGTPTKHTVATNPKGFSWSIWFRSFGTSFCQRTSPKLKILMKWSMLPLETEWKIRLRKLLRLNNHQCLSHRMQMPNGNHHRTPTFVGSGSMKWSFLTNANVVPLKDSLKEMNKPSTLVSLWCLVCLMKTLMHSFISEDNPTDAGIQKPNNQQHLSLA